MQQENMGGDNIARDKIGTQVNNPGTYNETYIFNTNMHVEKPLYIMIISKVRAEIEQDHRFSNIQAFYGSFVKEWKPFGDENIEQILHDFQEKTQFHFTQISYIDQCVDIDEFMEEYRKKTIFILDGLTNCNFSQLIDSTHDEIAGFIIVKNQYYDDNLLLISKSYFKNKWKKFYERIAKPCPNIEICVDSKELLFRRLTNFAGLQNVFFSKSKIQASLSEHYSNSHADTIDVMGNNLR